jgi:hypothetical protein
MAEFQFFSDVAIDTSNKENLRAFIDSKRDDKGHTIADKDGNVTLQPVDPKKAELLLGKRPDILLHGSSNWKKGHNTGSTGVTDPDTQDKQDIPAGQFTPVAGIATYKPDPSITTDPSNVSQ